MSDNELLLAISKMMDNKLEPITNDIREIKEDIKNLKTDVETLKSDVKVLKSDVETLEVRVKRIELNPETEILPQGNTTVSCYKDTYDRYRTYTDKIDNVFDDISLFKKVVSEHSIKLQSLS